jgi:exodeoxyribonuclease VII small subunit
MADEKQNFEQSLKKLETLVGEMESGELPLDEMMKRFEEGRRLVAFCTKELEAIRQRIDQVTSAVPPTVEPMDILKS